MYRIYTSVRTNESGKRVLISSGVRGLRRSYVPRGKLYKGGTQLEKTKSTNGKKLHGNVNEISRSNTTNELFSAIRCGADGAPLKVRSYVLIATIRIIF